MSLRITVARGLCGAVLALACAGCGTMQHERVEDGRRGQAHYRMRSDRPIRVRVGRVDAAPAKLDPALRDAVERYLLDQAAAALGRHDLFEVVDTRVKSESLLDQFMEDEDTEHAAAAVDGVLDIRVLAVKERKGATVRIGILSKQSKQAHVNIDVNLRLEAGTETFRTKAKGTSTKGAVGMVAMVKRDAMSKKGGVWELAGSMVGRAGAKAIDDCVSEIAHKLHRRLRRLDGDALDRLLRPRVRYPTR